MAAADLLCGSIASAAAAIRGGQISPLELTRAALARIEALDPTLQSYVLVTAELAVDQARAAEAELAAGIDRGPLHGIPVGLKDVYATRGIRTTAQSRVLLDWVPDVDATTVVRLREAGAVLLGKHGLAELAIGGPTADGAFPPPRNPWNLDHVPGGSSSGSGAAVAAGLGFGALGTDCGGSIRKPAAHCGIVGLKPTYGRVSRHGILPLAWSLDHAGPMARTVDDCAILLGAIAGPDPLDPTSSHAPVPDYRASLDQGVRGLRLGVPRSWLQELGTIEGDVLEAFEAALGVLAAAGARIVDLGGEALIAARAPTTLIMVAEGYASHETTFQERAQLLTRGVRNRLREGAFVSSADYLDALRARTAISAQVRQLLTDVDAILSPTCARPAERFDDADPESRFREPSFVNPWNLVGFPALSLPCGFSRLGLPIGLQVAAGPFEEPLVLRIASAFERATPWHERHPSVALETSGRNRAVGGDHVASPRDPSVSPAAADDAEIEAILRHAAFVSLPLTTEEARELVTGVRRIRAMAEAVRALATPDTEPSGSQVAPSPREARPAGPR